MSPELARELRETRPVASAELRERVLAVAAEPTPAPRRRFVWPVRRVEFVALPTVVAAGLAVAVVHGIVNGSPPNRAARATPAVATVGSARSDQLRSPAIPQGAPSGGRYAVTIPNTPARLQQYGARLRVQVKNRDELSDATKRAMRFAR